MKEGLGLTFGRMDKPTLIAGFSPRPGRYSLLAYEFLRRHGYPVILMNMRGGEYEANKVFRFCSQDVKTIPIHTITLYLRPAVQAPYYDCLLDIKPQRIIFNPGTENPEFEKICRERGVEVVRGCTLVMLRTGQY